MRPITLLALAGITYGSACPSGPKQERTLYFLDSNPTGASIVSLPVWKDGTLGDPVKTSTGGMGGISMDANGPVDKDPVFSQDAVVVSGSRLFAVNPGSGTLSLFTIDKADPLHPNLLDSASTMGDFPNSVAYSPRHHIACAVNTGAVSGVACFSVSTKGLEPMGSLMPINVTQTTPPVGPPGTSSDIVFNPSQDALFVSVKGNGMDNGFLYAYPVKEGKVTSDPVVSRPDGLLIDFSLSFSSDYTAVITDPSHGASLLSISSDYSVSVLKRVEIPNQVATCWSVFSDRFDSVYVFDGASSDVVTLSPKTGDIKYVIPGPENGGGSFDAVQVGRFLYVLGGNPGVAVFDLTGSVGNGKVPKVVEFKDLSGLGARAGWTGLAAYPN